MDPTLNEKGEWIVTRGDQRMRMPANGYFFDGDWMSRWERKPEEEVLELCTRYAEEIYKETPYACIFKGVPQGLSFASYFGGIEFACRMYTDPDAIHAENEAKCAESIRTFDNVNKAFGPWIQMVAVGDDMGTQQGPMCAPQLMEELCMPYYARFCRHVHENSDIKVFMHNCGSIRPLIPLLIEAGIDVLNPVQISADDMDPFDLKREFGDRIVFWGGGCNTQAVLGSGTPADVQQNVEHLVGAFKPGGGYVFNQVHNIVGNVPPENIVGMLDTAYRESFY
jgi:uroporphyrinogen decarboxylase